MRVKAFSEFIKDVKQGTFPSPQYEVDVTDELVQSFCNSIENKK